MFGLDEELDVLDQIIAIERLLPRRRPNPKSLNVPSEADPMDGIGPRLEIGQNPRSGGERSENQHCNGGYWN